MKRIQLILFFVCLTFSPLIAQFQIGQDINGKAAGDNSGQSVFLSSNGKRVAIGAAHHSSVNGYKTGHARVFEENNGIWTQVGQSIDGVAPNDNMLCVVLSSDGKRIAVGAANNDGNGMSSGHVRIFEDINGDWYQLGQDIKGEAAMDFSGESISLSSDGTRVAIGATGNDENGSSSGHVRIFHEVNGTWLQLGLDIDGEAAGDRSGHSVSLSSDGTRVAIGAHYNAGNGIKSGHVRIFQESNGSWIQLGQDIDGEAQSDHSGKSVSLSADGTIVAIGAWANGGGGFSSGHVRVFQESNGNWVQIGQDIDGEASHDQFGTSVSLSSDGQTVAIGRHPRIIALVLRLVEYKSIAIFQAFGLKF